LKLQDKKRSLAEGALGSAPSTSDFERKKLRVEELRMLLDIEDQ